MPCLLMQLVNVLRHQRNQHAALLQLHQRAMPVVWLRTPCRRTHAILPRQLTHFRIFQIVAERRHLFGFRVTRPQTIWAAIIGDSRIGRNTRAGKHGDAQRLRQQRARFVQRLRRHIFHRTIFAHTSRVWTNRTSNLCTNHTRRDTCQKRASC